MAKRFRVSLQEWLNLGQLERDAAWEAALWQAEQQE